jgi:hypothetical protein
MFFIFFIILGFFTKAGEYKLKKAYNHWLENDLKPWWEEGKYGKVIASILWCIFLWINVITHEIWHGMAGSILLLFTWPLYVLGFLDYYVCPTGMSYEWKLIEDGKKRWISGVMWKRIRYRGKEISKEHWVNKLTCCAPFIIWAILIFVFAVRMAVYLQFSDVVMTVYLFFAWQSGSITLSNSDLQNTWPIFTNMYISNPHNRKPKDGEEKRS